MTPGRGWRLPFRLLGIPISLDPTFGLVLPLFAWLIANQVGAFATILEPVGIVLDADVLTRGVTPYVLGLIAALGLFASVVVHELGHAMAARIYGVRTKMITLWFLGGVAQLEDMPRARGAEAVVAIVGPIVSGALSFAFAGVLRVFDLHGGAAFVIAYLALMNAGLAIFNLLPALPLDGGRVLRSLLAIPMDRERATVIAGNVSRAVAILLGVYGIFSFQLFLVIIAFFVFNAGRAEVYAERARQAFEGRSVADVMTVDPVTVDLDMPLAQFRQLRSFKPHPCYPVVDAAGVLAGLARIDDAEKADPDATLATILREADTARPGEDLQRAVQRLAGGDLGRLVVIDPKGRVIGILSRTDVVRVLRHENAAP
ncbi:MAG: site-2 protease family protein [Trueperaceae bacterium]|nr:site-2 protease family protein [Trueperaceae bacterium]